MSSLLPFVALMSVPKNRRRRLLPLALPAVAGMPVAQAGTLAVVSADSAARREGNVATAEGTSAVAAVLTAAVDKGASLTVDDLKNIPLAQKVVAANPDILTPSSLQGASRADLQRALAVIQDAMAKGDGAKPNGDPKQPAAGAKTPRSPAKR